MAETIAPLLQWVRDYRANHNGSNPSKEDIPADLGASDCFFPGSTPILICTQSQHGVCFSSSIVPLPSLPSLPPLPPPHNDHVDQALHPPPRVPSLQHLQSPQPASDASPPPPSTPCHCPIPTQWTPNRQSTHSHAALPLPGNRCGTSSHQGSHPHRHTKNNARRQRAQHSHHPPSPALPAAAACCSLRWVGG